ncbi:MAG: hypothetical protein IKP03_10910 [Fibrobacter sp.]|nr:hypothetical protein [Fibrobacter sp.]
MIEFINRVTGGQMWVADDRKDEYLAAGHRLAVKPVKAEKKPAKKPAAKKGPAKK